VETVAGSLFAQPKIYPNIIVKWIDSKMDKLYNNSINPYILANISEMQIKYMVLFPQMLIK
jgi:hypothetical protein